MLFLLYSNHFTINLFDNTIPLILNQIFLFPDSINLLFLSLK